MSNATLTRQQAQSGRASSGGSGASPGGQNSQGGVATRQRRRNRGQNQNPRDVNAARNLLQAARRFLESSSQQPGTDASQGSGGNLSGRGEAGGDSGITLTGRRSKRRSGPASQSGSQNASQSGGQGGGAQGQEGTQQGARMSRGERRRQRQQTQAGGTGNAGRQASGGQVAGATVTPQQMIRQIQSVLSPQLQRQLQASQVEQTALSILNMAALREGVPISTFTPETWNRLVSQAILGATTLNSRLSGFSGQNPAQVRDRVASDLRRSQRQGRQPATA